MSLKTVSSFSRKMNGRIFALVFFFWALLTIITPTLIIWSASAKPSLGSPDEGDFGVRARRLMMGHPESYHWIKLALAPTPTPIAESKPITGEGLHHELMSVIEKTIDA